MVKLSYEQVSTKGGFEDEGGTIKGAALWQCFKREEEPDNLVSVMTETHLEFSLWLKETVLSS